MKNLIILLFLLLPALAFSQKKADKNKTLISEHIPTFAASVETHGTDLHDYEPPQWQASLVLEINAINDIELTGLEAIPWGGFRILVNGSLNGSEIKLKKEDSNSLATNQFKGSDTTLKAGMSVMLAYSYTLQGWVIPVLK